MIKCISFDLWGTLIKGNPAYKAARTEIIADYVNLNKIPKDQINSIIEKVKTDFNDLSEKYGYQFKSDEIYRCAFEQLNITKKMHHEHIKCRLRDAFYNNPPIIIEGTLEAIDKLANQYKIVLVSNTVLVDGDILYRALSPARLWNCFSVITFSNEQEFAKPSPVIFERTYKKLNIMPSEVVHVGDNTHTDGAIIQLGGIFEYINGKSNKTIKDIEVQYGNSVLS